MRYSKNLFPIADAILAEYKSYRVSGNGREAAIALLKQAYADELQDPEDALSLMLGIVLALSKKRELTQEIAEETRKIIASFRHIAGADDPRLDYIVKVEYLLLDTAQYGTEAVYRRHTPYVPDWQIGDTFVHTLSHPEAVALGIDGWAILLCKVGEYTDKEAHPVQLMYTSLCPPESLPSSATELNALGFLPVMQADGGKQQYLVQILLKSKQDELGFGMTKIGTFPEIIVPEDAAIENPYVSYPFFGLLHKEDAQPAYETDICRLYRRNCKNRRKL